MKNVTKKKAKKYVNVLLPPMTYEEIGRIAVCAHERNMTLNDYIVQAAVKHAKEVLAYQERLEADVKQKKSTKAKSKKQK